MLQKMYLDDLKEMRDSGSQGKYAKEVNPKKLDFLFYWVALINKKWPIFFFTAFMTTIAIFYTQVATPVYAANAVLLLESQKANIISIEDLVSSEQDSLDYYGTQYAILKSRALAERVILQLEAQGNIPQSQFAEKLAPSPMQQLVGFLSKPFRLFGWGDETSPTNKGKANSSSTVSDVVGADGSLESTRPYSETEFSEILSQFRQSLRVSPVVKTKLVSVVYESTDPEFSALAANAVAEQYIESVLERRRALKSAASEWMDGRIKELKVKLDESEDSLLSFKKANGLVGLNGDVSRLNDQQLIFTSSELATARNELSNANDLYETVKQFQESSPSSLETLPFVQNDVAVRTAKAELGDVQRELVELRNRYGAKHPTIVNAETNLRSLRSSLASQVRRAVATFENDYQLLQQRVEALEASVTLDKDNFQIIEEKKITLEAMEREVSANRDQYNELFDRIAEVRITDGLDEANAVVAEPAWVPTNPIKPNKIFIIGLVFLGSLLLSAFVSFLLEYLDDTVNSTDDIERRLKSKLLGVFPLVNSGSLRRNNELPLTPHEAVAASETFSEAVNTCRTALTVRNESKMQVILVTSSVPNEGKSTVALNLAHSFGQLERTLLIDCDLRKPSIAKALSMPIDSPGLSNLLLGTIPLEGGEKRDVMKRGIMDSFDCLTSGPIPDQPLEMLASTNFVKVLDTLRQRYDKIIIDSAPTHVVSDALILSKLADSVLYVVKPHETPIKLVSNGLSRLADARASVPGVRAPVSGICISQVDLEKSKSYDGLEFHGLGVDYHGYGSYYRYGDQTGQNLKEKFIPDGLQDSFNQRLKKTG